MVKHPAEIAENSGKLLRLERNGTSVMVYMPETAVESATATELVDLAAAITYFADFDIEESVLQEAFIQADGASIYVAFDENLYRYRILQDDSAHITDTDALIDPVTQADDSIVLAGTLPAWEVYLVGRGKGIGVALASTTILKADIQNAFESAYNDYANTGETYRLLTDKGYMTTSFGIDAYSNSAYWNTALTTAADMTCDSVSMESADPLISTETYIGELILSTTNDFDPDDTALTLPVIKCSAIIEGKTYTFYAMRTSETAMSIKYMVSKNREFLNAVRNAYGNIVSNDILVLPADVTGKFAIDILEY